MNLNFQIEKKYMFTYIEKDLPMGHFYECNMKRNKPKFYGHLVTFL